MSPNLFQQGRIPFKIPERDEPCETYYKIYGNLRNGYPPLVVLHGGPGSGHEYLEPYSKLWPRYGIPVVFYDQIGCAASTHLPEKKGNKHFWQPSLFIAELQNLLKHLNIGQSDGPGFHLFGHSWGAILAVAFIADQQPPGLQRLVLAGGPADSALFRENLRKLISQLPTEHQEAINEAIRRDDVANPIFSDAMMSFERTFTCRADPWPPEMLHHLKHQAEDSTVRESLLGHCPFSFNGSLEHYSSIPLFPKINVPTLLMNGEFDTALENCQEKFFEGIPKVRWVTLLGASHMPHLDSEDMLEKVLKLVGRFLQPNDASTA